MTDRVFGFDLLRGICALAVLVYHVLYWNDAGNLYNLGTYGVYIFFVLSGASMYVAYAEKFRIGYSPAKFMFLRLIRLMPLYVFAMAIALAIKSRGGVDLERIGHAYLNIFFLFGLGNPGATSQVTGGWSLGIEFVFYLVFPVMLSLVAGRYWLATLVLAFTSQHVFINTALNRSLAEDWVSYTQFLSFVFYFVAGCAIGRFHMEGKLPKVGWWVMLPALIAIGITSQATSEASLMGITGVTLSLLAVIAAAASASIRGGKFCELLGRSSYGVYILHPLIAGTLKTVFKGLPLPALLAITIVFSLGLALLLERYFERPVQEWLKGKTIGRRAVPS